MTFPNLHILHWAFLHSFESVKLSKTIQEGKQNFIYIGSYFLKSQSAHVAQKVLLSFPSFLFFSFLLPSLLMHSFACFHELSQIIEWHTLHKDAMSNS